MPDILIPLDDPKCRKILQRLLTKKGGMAAMAVSSVPEILEDWKLKGINAISVDAVKLQEAIK